MTGVQTCALPILQHVERRISTMIGQLSVSFLFLFLFNFLLECPPFTSILSAVYGDDPVKGRGCGGGLYICKWWGLGGGGGGHGVKGDGHG